MAFERVVGKQRGLGDKFANRSEIVLHKGNHSQRGVGNKIANRSEIVLHKGEGRQRGVGDKLANWGEIISYIIAIGWAND